MGTVTGTDDSRIEKPRSETPHISIPHIGALRAGPVNAITDVPGVRVGHCTIDAGPFQTGATVVLPGPEPLFDNPLPAGVDIINGFGKSAGLMQVRELGRIESPIALVNTFAVGEAYSALVRDAIRLTPDVGRDKPTTNPLVLECNDGWLNDNHGFALQAQHVTRALEAARAADTDSHATLAQGSIGAGRGMSCHGLKGGIGSASRMLPSMDPRPAGHDGRETEAHTVGVLVLANQGRPDALIIDGHRVGDALQARVRARGEADREAQERGSIIILIACTGALDARQLGRIARRASAGLARTGSDFGHGSGDIAVAFSTIANADSQGRGVRPIRDEELDPWFQAVAEATEQAIVNALFHATSVTGRNDRRRFALLDLAPDWTSLQRRDLKQEPKHD